MNEPCTHCNKKYKCDAYHMACPEFRFFVNTGYTSRTQDRTPSREIYAEIFHTPPVMTARKTLIRRKHENNTTNR